MDQNRSICIHLNLFWSIYISNLSPFFGSNPIIFTRDASIFWIRSRIEFGSGIEMTIRYRTRYRSRYRNDVSKRIRIRSLNDFEYDVICSIRSRNDFGSDIEIKIRCRIHYRIRYRNDFSKRYRSWKTKRFRIRYRNYFGSDFEMI